MTDRRARQLIDAAKVAINIGTIVPVSSESVARPLASLEPEQQRQVWQEAVDTAPEGKVTAAHVERIKRTFSFPGIAGIADIAEIRSNDIEQKARSLGGKLSRLFKDREIINLDRLQIRREVIGKPRTDGKSGTTETKHYWFEKA